MSNKPTATSKPPEITLQQVVVKWLSLLAHHFEKEIDEMDYATWEMGLQGLSAERVEKAFERCLRECEWMPHVADVRKRLPEAERKPYALSGGSGFQSKEAQEFLNKVREIGKEKKL